MDILPPLTKKPEQPRFIRIGVLTSISSGYRTGNQTPALQHMHSPILLYGSEIWCVTSTLEKKIDALDNWCLRRILHIHWTNFVSNDVVRSRTEQQLLSYYPSTALVLLWSSVPCRHRSRPLSSSPGLHSGSSQRLATENWKTERESAQSN